LRLQQWKRLDAAGFRLRYQHRQVIAILSKPGESMESIELKIERWKAGETVEGIAGEYLGGEIDLVRVVGVTPSPRQP